MVRLTRLIRLPVPLALLGAAVAVAGCATAPSGGPPRQAPGGSSQAQSYVQLLPAPGPTSSWNATQVVLGFLHASASYAFDPAAAKQYLVPPLRKQWHPGREPVAVVGAPTSSQFEIIHLGPSESPVLQTVRFTGQHLATLSQTGQYQYAPGQNAYKFVLAKTNGVWLIEQLPQQQTLLLTESDFEDVYQPRNLFFFAPPAGGQTPSVLVPDPVYAPLVSSNSALNTDLATGLVNGLLKGQGGWLSGATVSAFPRGTTLLRKVTITGKTAQVDLGGAAAHAQPITVLSMAAQLLATLRDGEYSLPLASQLDLYIDNSPRPVIPPVGLVPTVASGPVWPVLLVTGPGSVGELPAVPKPPIKPQPRLGPAQLGQADVTAVAASPDQDRPEFAVAVPDGAGCTVEVRSGSQGAYQSYPLSGSVGPCASLSYDANGNLWAVAGKGVWVMQPSGAPVAVNLSALAAALQPGGQILTLRMAPDAVRAALLVQTSAGNRLLLAAVRLRSGTASFGQPVSVGVGLNAAPQAISWYDAYHLAVLDAGGIYELPLTGGAGQEPGAAPFLFSTAPQGADSLTTDGSEFVVGTSGGQVWAGSVSAPSWSLVGPGADPTYPG
ncbi:MAG: LpqB family beta-propeller domain-containing protein [Streptosporangiaceae bacterium]